MMELFFARPVDLPKWLEVALDVGEIMRVPDLHTNENFLQYAKRKIEQKNAIMAYDGRNKKCSGVIGFSHSNNSITWLGVKKEYRNKGIGSKLLLSAINELDKNRRITVNTYPRDYIPGQAARRLYTAHGFIETISEPFLIDGLEMVELSFMPKII